MDTFILISLFMAFSSLIGFACFKIGWVTGYAVAKENAAEVLDAGRSLGKGIVA